MITIFTDYTRLATRIKLVSRMLSTSTNWNPSPRLHCKLGNKSWTGSERTQLVLILAMFRHSTWNCRQSTSITQLPTDLSKLLRAWSVMRNFKLPTRTLSTAHLEVKQFICRIFDWTDALLSVELAQKFESQSWQVHCHSNRERLDRCFEAFNWDIERPGHVQE